MNLSFFSMPFGKVLLIQLAVCALFGTNAESRAGEIYKSVDAHGRVTYSDQPSPSAKRVTVPPTPKSAATERERIFRQMESYAQADAERLKKAEAEQKEKAEKKAAEEHRKELCKRARDRYLNFSEARRPYRRDDQGNRVYYSSAEIDAEWAAAQREMDLQCSAK